MRLRHGGRDERSTLEFPADLPDMGALVDDAYDAVLVTDLDGAIVYWNKAAGRLYTREWGLDVGANVRDLVPEIIRPQLDEVLATVAAGRAVPPASRPITAAEDVLALAEVAVTPVRDHAGEVVAASFFVRYIVEGMQPGADVEGVAVGDSLREVQVSARRALALSEARYRAVVDTTDQGVGLVDADGVFVFLNRQLADFLGESQDALIGRSAVDLLSDPSRLETVRATGQPARYELFHTHPDAGTLCGLVSVSAVEDETGPGGALVMVSDITDLKRAQSERERQAVVDPLTELANAALFYDRVERAMRLAPSDATAAVLVADVDRFRDVNEALGHTVADELLRVVGARVAEAAPEDATVARIVGDQFAVFVEDVGAAAGLEELTRRIHDAVAVPTLVGTLELVPSVSIGVAFVLAGGERATTVRTIGAPRPRPAEDVLRRAHAAMRIARERGPGHTASDAVGAVDRVATRLALIPELRRAIQRGELELMYQPAFDLESGEITSIEALVRWRHPERGLLQPSLFIPEAEESGLIGELGRWVLERACSDAVRWHTSGIVVPVAVNVSGRQIAEERFVGDVGAVLVRTGIDPHLLVLEVTESVLVDDADALVARLRSLRRAGCRIAIDDFGTGYSSLAQLGRLPLDVLKIDRSFVRDIAVSERAAALVRSVVDVAHAFKLEVIAEGVETEAQRRALMSLGCPSAQGFFWSAAMSETGLLRWMGIADDGSGAA